MPRHAHYVPHGVIPAVLLPFNDDLSIDEKSFRSHLRDVAATKGISAITINAHSTEVASCSFDEQRRVLDIAQDEIGARLPIINGIWADGSLEAARIARMAAEGGASALLVFPPAPFTLGQSPAMAMAHFKRIADASDLPIIAFQYPLATGQGYPNETLLRMVDDISSIRAMNGNSFADARRIYDRINPLASVFYAQPWADMHNLMKEALVLLGRLPH